MTQNTQFTAGPWLIANNGKQGKRSATFRIWRNDPDQPQGDDFTNRGYDCIAPHVHGEANASLIAAAPMMYAALRNLVEFIEEYGIRDISGRSLMEDLGFLDDQYAALKAADGEA